MYMKKILKRLTGFLTIFIVITGIAANTVKVKAYDADNYTNNAGYYYVDNSHNTDSHVVLYVLIPNSLALEGNFTYKFKCTNGTFPNGETGGLLAYTNRFDTVTTVADVGTGKLVSFKFGIENGTYVFSTNDYSNNTITLNSNYENPCKTKIDYSNIAATKKEYPVTVNNETITLYSIYGKEEFIESNIAELSAYAKGIQTTSAAASSDSDIEELRTLLKKSGLSDSEIEEFIFDLLSENADDSLNLQFLDAAVSSDTVTIINSSDNTEGLQEKEEYKNITAPVICVIFFILFFISWRLTKRKIK